MTVKLNWDQVHSADFKQKFYWDGYDLVFVKSNPAAYTQKNAVFRRGRWYTVLDRVSFNDDGVWEVKDKYVNSH